MNYSFTASLITQAAACVCTNPSTRGVKVIFLSGTTVSFFFSFFFFQTHDETLLGSKHVRFVGARHMVSMLVCLLYGFSSKQGKICL